MSFQTTLAALRSGWHLVLIGVLIALATAVWFDANSVPVYSTSASYVVSPGAAVAPDDVANGVDTLDSSRSRSIMTTLTEITDSAANRAEAFATLGLDSALKDSYTVESVVVPEANVMETIVTGPDPAIAAELASILGDLGGVRFVALYRIYDVGVLDEASVPTEPSNPGMSQLGVIAGAMGLMVGGALALLRWAWAGRSGDTIRSRLGAYSPRVADIEEHSRFKRVG